MYIYIIYHFIFICIYLYNVANDRRCIYVHLVTVPDPRTTVINGERDIFEQNVFQWRFADFIQ